MDRTTPKKRAVVVQKYGGSSVADVEKLGRVADRIAATRRAGHDVVVVVSAMGKTTDGLLELARQVAGDADTPRRELDMLVSTGERVAMALLSIAIQARGLGAISFTGSQCGIMTNDRHFDARIIEVRPHRIEDELARGNVVIVAGYQGVSYKREITTLGRGGSDTTAVALAAALGAERCELYSDVDGVYSADPRSVSEASHLPEVDFDTLQEMAESGAKVVCAQAVEWAQRSGVAIYARASFDPIVDTPRQTVVRKYAPSETPRARGVSAAARVAWIEVGAGGAALVRAASDAGVALIDFATGAHASSAIVSLTNTPDWPAARARLEATLPGITVRDDVSLVSVVGGGLLDAHGAVQRFEGALEEAGVAVVATRATALRLTAVVPQDDRAKAEQALHAALV